METYIERLELSALHKESTGETMKALFVDVDGKIPNLFLMKMSTYIKAGGGKAVLMSPTPTLSLFRAS